MDIAGLLPGYSYYLRLERNMSPRTVASYVSDVKEAAKHPYFGEGIEEVTPDAILAYLEFRADLSKRSQARVLSALRSFFGWAVAEGYRSKGAGTRLMEEIMRRFSECGFITLEVRKSNEGAIRFYRKFGFVQVGLRRDFYEKPTEDAVLMTKLLGEK